MSELVAEKGLEHGGPKARKRKEYMLLGVAGASLLGLFLYMRKSSTAAATGATVTDPNAYTYPAGVGSGADISGSNPGSSLNELFGQNEEMLRLLSGLSTGTGGATGDPTGSNAGSSTTPPGPAAGNTIPTPVDYANDPNWSASHYYTGNQAAGYTGHASWVNKLTGQVIDAITGRAPSGPDVLWTTAPAAAAPASATSGGTAGKMAVQAATGASTPITSAPASSATLAESHLAAANYLTRPATPGLIRPAPILNPVVVR